MPKKPNNDPLALFKEFSAIPAVSTAETRLFDRLVTYWSGLRNDSLRNPLTLREAGEGQLLVEWTNDVTSRRRVVLIAHTDREGHVVNANQTHLFSDHVLVAHQPFGQDEDAEEFVGTRVQLVAGKGAEADFAHTARVISNSQIPELLLEPGQVLLQLEGGGNDTAKQIDSILKDSRNVLTAHQLFDELQDGSSEVTGNSIRAIGVDNAAGVAVSTAVLSQIVGEKRQTNVSVLYTTGEETGFLGLLSVLMTPASYPVRTQEDVLWVVVDSSDVRSARAISLDTWSGYRIHGTKSQQAVDLEVKLKGGRDWNFPCASDCSAIRLEDKLSIYDTSAARMLYQAAVGARNAQLQNGGRMLDGIDKARYESINFSKLGTLGAFFGGVCEAGVLCHAEHFRRAIDAPRRQGGDRFGSIAIPLGNYRFRLGDTLEPETTTVGALNSAYIILLSACALHKDYWYVPATRQGYRGRDPYQKALPNGYNAYKDEEDLVNMWMRRYRDRRGDYILPLQAWLRHRLGIAK